MKPEDIIRVNREKMGLTQEAMGHILGLKLRAYQKLESGDFPKYKRNIIAAMDNMWGTDLMRMIYAENVRSDFSEVTVIGNPKAVYNTKNKDFVELSDGKFIMSTPLVSHKAQAGYLTGWGDEEYISDLPQFPIIVDKPHRGDYVSFEVSGESMNDGTSMSINPGDIVTGRKIDRSHWKNKLHLKKYTEFVIVSIKGGIIVKEIAEHDTENCTIVCRSRNPDKKKYPDQVIHLNEVIQIFNIVQVTKKR